MHKKPYEDQKIQLLLLQESIWQIEDKIDKTLKELTKQETTLLQLKSMAEALLEKLGMKSDQKRARRPPR